MSADKLIKNRISLTEVGKGVLIAVGSELQPTLRALKAISIYPHQLITDSIFLDQLVCNVQTI